MVTRSTVAIGIMDFALDLDVVAVTPLRPVVFNLHAR